MEYTMVNLVFNLLKNLLPCANFLNTIYTVLTLFQKT